MPTALRLDQRLVQEAEAAANLLKRSVPKQIEHWAEIGKLVGHQLAPEDILALSQGLADVRVSIRPTERVDPQQVFSQLQADRRSGTLAQSVVEDNPRYQASQQVGMIEKISEDGGVEIGTFRDGRFVPAP